MTEDLGRWVKGIADANEDADQRHAKAAEETAVWCEGSSASAIAMRRVALLAERNRIQRDLRSARQRSVIGESNRRLQVVLGALSALK